MSSAITLRDQQALRRVHLGTCVSVTVLVSHLSVVSDFRKVIFLPSVLTLGLFGVKPRAYFSAFIRSAMHVDVKISRLVARVLGIG